MTSKTPTQAMAEARSEAVSNIVHQFPARELGAHAITLVFKSYRYENSRALVRSGGRTRAAERINNAVVLPIPTNLTDTFSMRVAGAELGGLGSIAAASVQSFFESGGDFDQAATHMLSEYGISPEELANGLKGDISDKRMAQVKSLLKSQLDRMGLGKPIDAGTGRITNPHITLMFDGMDLKNHTFSWQLAAKNVEDSEAIKNIINLIKRNALPAYEDSALMAKGLLRFPNVVDVYFSGIDQSHFMYFKTCMIQSIGTDYTPNGVAILKGGKPAFVNLTLQLMETNIHTADDY